LQTRLEDESDREETTISTEGGDTSDGRSPGDPLERLDALSSHDERLPRSPGRFE